MEIIDVKATELIENPHHVKASMSTSEIWPSFPFFSFS